MRALRDGRVPWPSSTSTPARPKERCLFSPPPHHRPAPLQMEGLTPRVDDHLTHVRAFVVGAAEQDVSRMRKILLEAKHGALPLKSH